MSLIIFNWILWYADCCLFGYILGRYGLGGKKE